MPVNHSLKTIFIHIPKTAGSSLEYALGMHGNLKKVGIERYLNQQKDVEHLFGEGLQHFTARQIRHKLGREIFAEYFKFSVVRNPYDRLVSYVAWLNGKWEKGETLSRETFSEFLRKEEFRIPLRRPYLPGAQFKYLFISGKPAIELVINFEDMDKGIRLLQEKLDINLLLDTRMQSVHHEYRYYYTREQYRQIYRYYKKDFTYFNYPEI